MNYFCVQGRRALVSHFVLCLGLALGAAQAWGAAPCTLWPSMNEDGIGPYDYRDPARQQLLRANVEVNHFNSNVEMARGGMSGTVAADLHFVLHRFPNHPRALAAMIRVSEKEKTDRPRGASTTVECYLYRAVLFSPEDGIAKLIYGTYLFKKQRYDEALKELSEADTLSPDNANINYNLGLLYVQKKDYEKATVHAKKAYELKFPLPGLKEQLRKAGAWDGR